nr:ABC-2 family transporter protein [Treponema pedis]
MLPLTVCFNFPVLFMVKNLNGYYIFYSFFSTSITFYISNLIFKEGLKKYASSGS